MRFKEILQEARGREIRDKEEFFKKLKKDCSQFLAANKKNPVFIYRGSDSDGVFEYVEPYKKRRPVDMNSSQTKFVNQAIEKEYKIKNIRNTGLFASSRKYTAGHYGSVRVLFPVNGTKIFCSGTSDTYSDFFSGISKNRYNRYSAIILKYVNSHVPKEVFKYIDKNDYIDICYSTLFEDIEIFEEMPIPENKGFMKHCVKLFSDNIGWEMVDNLDGKLKDADQSEIDRTINKFIPVHKELAEMVILDILNEVEETLISNSRLYDSKSIRPTKLLKDEELIITGPCYSITIHESGIEAMTKEAIIKELSK